MTTHDPDQPHDHRDDIEPAGPHRSLLQSRTGALIAVLTSVCILIIALVILGRW